MRLRLRPYLLIATALAIGPFASALVWGRSVDVAVLVALLLLVISAEVMLGVWAVASFLTDRAKASGSLIEKARSQLDWRVQYESANLFKSLKGMHQDNVNGWRRLADHPHGARRQGDRAVKALRTQEQMLLKQHHEIAALRELVVELVARVDSAPDQAAPQDRLAPADRWVSTAGNSAGGGPARSRGGENSKG